MENGGILPNNASWYGLEAYQMGIYVTNYFFMKMENNLETIYMAGQDHIFTIDLIFFWFNMPCWGVLHSVNGIFYLDEVMLVYDKANQKDNITSGSGACPWYEKIKFTNTIIAINSEIWQETIFIDDKWVEKAKLYKTIQGINSLIVLHLAGCGPYLFENGKGT